jgi:hypothetical protein
MAAPERPIEVAWALSQALDALGVVHTIGGSLAAAFAGAAPLDRDVDIDIVATLEEYHAARVVAALSDAFDIDQTSLRRAVRHRSCTNFVHRDTRLAVDLFVTGGTALDTQQVARRQAVTAGQGRMVPVHPPEDILLQKLRWYQRGGGSSDRQWRDIQGIIRVQGPRLDREYLREHAPAFGVEALLADALSEGGVP